MQLLPRLQFTVIAAGRSVQRALETVALLMVTALVAAHCDSKGSFEGHYE